MSAEYAPGTVAVATVKGERNVRVTRGEGIFANNWYTNRPVCGSNTAFPDSVVIDVRPLVVLDLDLAAHIGVGALVADLRTSGFYDLADQIEAQTKPPKPAEPTGLGAVVEDATYTRLDGVLAPWYKTGAHYADRPWRYYTDLKVVRALSEGVS